MRAETILRDLTARGITLIPDGDQLDVEAPDDLLTGDLLAALREHKAGLLAILTSPGRCPQCADKLNLQDRAAGEAAPAEPEPSVFAPMFSLEASGDEAEFGRVLADLDEDERYALEERAAIVEFDGGLTRPEAERQALAEWRVKTFEKPLPDELTKLPKAPFGTFGTGPDKGFPEISGAAGTGELLAILTEPGRCPVYRDKLDLQDRARDCWWCAGCRRFFDGQKQPYQRREQN